MAATASPGEIRKQPPWTQPKGGVVTGLKLTTFVPQSGRAVTWYTCGPTVYDLSHIGHARNYVSFDIVRRIMTDYFGYHVFQVMNITDIDDKIIKRSSESGVDFNELSRKMEDEFMKDMKALGVRPPDALTRVSEYVPEIVQYVEKIVERGYAYVTNGSVYFDVAAFTTKGNFYGRLEPSSVSNMALVEEGEGALSLELGQKKNPSDFALWKASKPGEPAWDSPWGRGRPGWHIECSAMASDLLGHPLDIHSGGIDLRFPHHDNELAQAEAYHGEAQWVNYFLHAGHLHIEGLKMSKSLKNFITIQEILKTYSARVIRMLFLKHKYNEPMDYAAHSMDGIVQVERRFNEFSLNVQSFLRESKSIATQHWDTAAKKLHETVRSTQRAVHDALMDDFNTPEAVRLLLALVNTTNAYMAQPDANSFVVRSAAVYVMRMLRVFGIVMDDDISFSSASAGQDEELSAVLDAFSAFRDTVRAAARAGDMKQVLAVSDAVRDEVLPQLGIRLEDRADAPSVWKRDDKDELIREMQRKKQAAEKKAEDARRMAAERAEKEAARLAKGKMSAPELFRSLTDQYSQFDAEGFPTHDAAGEPLSKNAVKKAKKMWEDQQKAHEAFLAHQSKAAAGAQ